MNKNSMRDVFMYYSHINGHTEKELAAMFGISHQRVYQIIRRVHRVATGRTHHGPTSEALKIYNSTVINLDN